MTYFVRAARRVVAAMAFAAAATAAQPALAADAAAVVAASTESAVTPGIGSLEEIVERAISAQAAAEAAASSSAVPTAAILTPSPATPNRTRSLAELVSEHAGVTPRDAQADCLASAIYFESNGEPLAGQLAVAEVIINRARSGRFASSLCGVITQRSQFSFVRGGRIPAAPRGTAAWRNAVAIAHIALDDLADSPVSTALFFHARRVSPGWRLRRIASVGNHVFYR